MLVMHFWWLFGSSGRWETFVLDDVDGSRPLNHRTGRSRGRSVRGVMMREVGMLRGVVGRDGSHTVAVLVEQCLMLLQRLTVERVRGHRFGLHVGAGRVGRFAEHLFCGNKKKDKRDENQFERQITDVCL